MTTSSNLATRSTPSQVPVSHTWAGRGSLQGTIPAGRSGHSRRGDRDETDLPSGIPIRTRRCYRSAECSSTDITSAKHRNQSVLLGQAVWYADSAGGATPRCVALTSSKAVSAHRTPRRSRPASALCGADQSSAMALTWLESNTSRPGQRAYCALLATLRKTAIVGCCWRPPSIGVGFLADLLQTTDHLGAIRLVGRFCQDFNSKAWAQAERMPRRPGGRRKQLLAKQLEG